MRQECPNLDLDRTHVERMPHLSALARPANEKTHPVNIDLFGTKAIVHVPNALAQLVQNTNGLQRMVAGFRGIFITGCLSSAYTE
jgi:hypothetical protein